MYGAMAGGAPHLAPADPGPYAVGAGGQCARNALCDKPCGHPGFCSGPRAAPAGERAAGGRVRRPCNPGAAAAPRCSTLRRVKSCEPDTGSDSDGGSGSAGSGSARSGWPGMAGRPLRASRGGEQHRRGAPAHGPRATAPPGASSGAPATRAAAVGTARRGAAAAAAKLTAAQRLRRTRPSWVLPPCPPTCARSASPRGTASRRACARAGLRRAARVAAAEASTAAESAPRWEACAAGWPARTASRPARMSRKAHGPARCARPALPCLHPVRLSNTKVT